MRVRKGDKVVVLGGKDKGKEAKVIKAFPESGKVVVEGVNIAKRHTRPAKATMQGGIIDKFMPLPVSTVAVVCGSCGRGTRIGVRIDDQGRKLRVCRRCGADL